MLITKEVINGFHELYNVISSKISGNEHWFNICKFICSDLNELIIISVKNILFFINQFSITKKLDEISDVTCLKLLNQEKIVVVGFSNGYIGTYDFDGNNLTLDQLNKHAVQNIDFKLGMLSVHYCSVIFFIPIEKFIQNLKNGKENKLLEFCEKKWNLPTKVKNSVIVGINNQSYFDYLLTATKYSGCTTVSRNNVPNQLLTLCIGIDNFLNFVYNCENFTPIQLSDVAKVVSQRIYDVLPFSVTKKPEVCIPTENVEVRFSFLDVGRSATVIKLSRCSKYAIFIDNFNQIQLIDNFKNVIIRNWCKQNVLDYQVEFFYYFEPKLHITYEFVIMLNVKTGLFEFYHLTYGPMFEFVQDEALNSVLISSSNSKPLLLSSSGCLCEISIPFYMILDIEIMRDRLDEPRLYAAIEHFFKMNPVDSIKQQLMYLLKRFQSEEIICKCLKLINLNEAVDLDFVLELCQEIHAINDSFYYCKNLVHVISLYQFLMTSSSSNTKNRKLRNQSINEILNETDNKNLAKLYDLFKNISTKKSVVRFNERLKFKEFLAIFNLNDKQLKSNWEMCLQSCRLLTETFENNLETAEFFLNKMIEYQIISYAGEFIEFLIGYWLLEPLNDSDDFDMVLMNFYSMIDTVCNLVKDSQKLDYIWKKCRKQFECSKYPFKAFIGSILCRNISQKYNTDNSDEDLKWETLSDDFCLWSLLIGKLEDISLLQIITQNRFSLNDIIEGGKDTITKIVTNWLVDINVEHTDFKNFYNSSEENDKELCQKQIVKHYVLLKNQFPYSLQKNTIVAYLSWNYAEKWLNHKQFDYLQSMIYYLHEIRGDHFLKIGLHFVIWKNFLVNIFESICHLVNTVGRIPKERLCKQDVSMSDIEIRNFLTLMMDFFNSFVKVVDEIESNKFADDLESAKKLPQPEMLWVDDEQKPTLIEIAKKVDLNFNILTIHYELCTVLNLIEAFNIKWPKFMSNLFEPSVSHIFFADFCNQKLQIDFCYNSKLKKTQTEFLTNIIRRSIDLLVIDSTGYSNEYKKIQLQIMNLASEWDLDLDILRRLQVQHLYMNGYDNLAIELLPAITHTIELGTILLKILGRRLKCFIDEELTAKNAVTDFPLIHPTIMSFLNSLDFQGKSSSLSAIKNLSKTVVYLLNDVESNEYKVANLIAEVCSKM